MKTCQARLANKTRNYKVRYSTLQWNSAYFQNKQTSRFLVNSESRRIMRPFTHTF